MLSIIGHWLYGALVSWGGIGAVIAAIAWVLWFITPAFLITYKSQLLHIAIAATVFTAAYTYAFTTGYNAGEAECKARWDAANIQIEKDKAKLAKDIAAEADKKVDETNAELERRSESFQREIDDYKAQLEDRKDGLCPLSSDDLKRLRGIK